MLARVKPVAFGDLIHLPQVQEYADAFHKATGVSLKLLPPDDTAPVAAFGEEGHSFCALVALIPDGCAACIETERLALCSAAQKLAPHQTHCWVGLTIVAVPVSIGGRHVASLLAGPVFRREPTQRDFEMVVKMLGGGMTTEAEKKARQAYFETLVVTVDRFQAIVQLLNMFGQFLAEFAGRCAIASGSDEPPVVARAKEFVQAHLEEPITLDGVARYARVSPFYFCKLFKKSTGITFTEYVARVRLERAKSLLVDPAARVSEVVYAAGFGSIPHFNSVFKRYVGMPPTQYRATLRSRQAT